MLPDVLPCLHGILQRIGLGRILFRLHQHRALVAGIRQHPEHRIKVHVAVTGDGESTDLANHYQIDNTSSALLTETADAGTEYLDSTLFLGDSNTVRLYNNGLISLQQFCAKEGIGTQVALNEGIVTFKNDTTHYTIAQAVAKMKPRRVVMTFGTNDTGMEVADFISNYTALVQAIQEAYPYTCLLYTSDAADEL